MAKSKNLEIKRWKKNMKEENKETNLQWKAKSDNKYGNYEKYYYDPKSNYVDSADDNSNHDEQKHFNGKITKEKSFRKLKSLRRPWKKSPIKLYDNWKNN